MFPLRPRPADFRATFVALGWGGIQAHYGANSRTIRRWMDEEGRDALVADRAAHVARLRERDRAFRRRVAVLAGSCPATRAAAGDCMLRPMTRGTARG